MQNLPTLTGDLLRAAPVWTVPIFVVMLGVLLVSLHRILTQPASERRTRLLLGGTVGIYAGWSTAAVWINAATVLLAGSPVPSVGGAVLVQRAALVGATGVAALCLSRFQGQLAYATTIGWALLGVIVSTAMAQQPILAGLASAGALAVGVITRQVRVGRRA